MTSTSHQLERRSRKLSDLVHVTGPLARHTEGFTASLSEQGYIELSLRKQLPPGRLRPDDALLSFLNGSDYAGCRPAILVGSTIATRHNRAPGIMP